MVCVCVCVVLNGVCVCVCARARACGALFGMRLIPNSAQHKPIKT